VVWSHSLRWLERIKGGNLMTDTVQWEFRIQTVGSALKQVKDEELEALLNEWGEDGWEVVIAHNLESSNKVRVIAKRPLSRTTARSRSWPG
jgi:hypothetical protein